jgi:hypothetical protein
MNADENILQLPYVVLKSRQLLPQISAIYYGIIIYNVILLLNKTYDPNPQLTDRDRKIPDARSLAKRTFNRSLHFATIDRIYCLKSKTS